MNAAIERLAAELQKMSDDDWLRLVAAREMEAAQKVGAGDTATDPALPAIDGSGERT